jgi:hypothetical protein
MLTVHATSLRRREEFHFRVTSEVERPPSLNLACSGALAILVGARAGQDFDDNVHERNRIPCQIDGSSLGFPERIIRLNIEVVYPSITERNNAGNESRRGMKIMRRWRSSNPVPDR